MCHPSAHREISQRKHATTPYHCRSPEEEALVISITVQGEGAGGVATSVDVVPFVIGREADCDLVVDDARVSRRHAQLEIQDDGRVVLRDLASANGTFVDDKRIEGGVWFAVPGSFRVGRTVLSVARVPDATSATMIAPPVTSTSDSPAPAATPMVAAPAAPVLTTPPPVAPLAIPALPAADGSFGSTWDRPAPRRMRVMRALSAVIGVLASILVVLAVQTLGKIDRDQDRLLVGSNAVTGMVVGLGLLVVALVLPHRDRRVWQGAIAVALFGLAQTAVFALIVVIRGGTPSLGLGFIFLVYFVSWLRREKSWWVAGADLPPELWDHAPVKSGRAAMSRTAGRLWIGGMAMVVAAIGAFLAPATVGSFALVPLGLAVALTTLVADLRGRFPRTWMVPAGIFAGGSLLYLVGLAAVIGRLDGAGGLFDALSALALVSIVILAVAAALGVRGTPLPWLLVAEGAALLAYGILAWEASGGRSWGRSLGGLLLAVGLGWVGIELLARAAGRAPGTMLGAARLDRQSPSRRTAWNLAVLAAAVAIGLAAWGPMRSLPKPGEPPPEPVSLTGPGIGQPFNSGPFGLRVTLDSAERIPRLDLDEDAESLARVSLTVTYLSRTSDHLDATSWHLYADGSEVTAPCCATSTQDLVPKTQEITFPAVPMGASLELKYKGFFDDGPVFSTALTPGAGASASASTKPEPTAEVPASTSAVSSTSADQPGSRPLVGPGIGDTFDSGPFGVHITVEAVNQTIGQGVDGVEIVATYRTDHGSSLDKTAWHLSADGLEVLALYGFDTTEAGIPKRVTIRIEGVPSGAKLKLTYQSFFDDVPVFSTDLTPSPV